MQDGAASLNLIPPIRKAKSKWRLVIWNIKLGRISNGPFVYAFESVPDAVVIDIGVSKATKEQNRAEDFFYIGGQKIGIYRNNPGTTE